MEQGVSGWFAAVLAAREKAGQPVVIAALARDARIGRGTLQRLKSGEIQNLGQEYVDRLAEALGVPAPRVGAVVGQGGASAAALAVLASVRADLEAAIKQIQRVERELIAGRSSEGLAAGAVGRKHLVDKHLQQPPTQRGGGAG